MSEVLKLQNIYKSFGKRMVVENISFSVNAGQIFGFLGPNGAGKTTTIKMILGLLAPDAGTIEVAGFDVQKDFENAMHHVSGIVENPDMYPYLSGYENLRMHARACGADESRVFEVVHMVGMQNRIKEKFKSYSLGMKQRLGVAQALLRNPKIMILDEPTNGLDPTGIKEFRDLLSHLAHTQGLAVLVSSHILQEMQLMCDTVGIIDRGRLLRVGSLDEITTQNSRGLYRYTLRPFDRAVALLQSTMPEAIAAVENGTVDLHLEEGHIPALNHTLMENGVVIYGLTPVSVSLEQSFIDITGGGNVIG